MPLITLAVCCYAAGLLLGFGGVIVPAVGVGVVAAAGAFLAPRIQLGACAVLLLAGVLVAYAAGLEERRCRARVLTSKSWLVTIHDAAAPGAFVRGEATAAGCTVPATLSVRAGVAGAGAQVPVTGLALPGRRGVRITAAVLRDPVGRSAVVSARGGAAARIDRVFGENAALARALLVADRGGLDPAMRERFATAGIAHLLSISGLHVGIIAMSVQLALGAMRLGRQAVLILSALATGGYVLLLGAPAPALRAGVMLAVITASRLAQRPTSPWAALALGAGVALKRPAVILEPGYQLTVSGMAAILASGLLMRRLAWLPRRGWRKALAGSLIATIMANLVTAPIIAWHFGAVSLIAPLTNLAATPVIGLLQPALFLALVLAWLPPVARFIADAAHPLFLLLHAIASAAAAAPYAALTIAPTLLGAMLALAAVTGVVIACASQWPARPLLVALAALVVATWSPLLPVRSTELELHMIDVGQGDAFAFRTPRGRWLLVDAGRSWRGGDAGRGAVIPYLRRRGGDVAGFILSHPHDDHVGGAASIMKALRPARYFDGAYVGGSATYLESLRAAERGKTRWLRVRPGDSIVVDGVRIRWLAPDSAWLTTLHDPNDGSVVARVEYGAVRFLLTGDAERAQERWLLANARELLQADVLKVGHHGSRTSTSADFLQAVSPRVALISAGAGNRYGHPSREVVQALARHGAEVLRTDAQGSVIVRTNGERIRVEVQGDRWDLPVVLPQQ